MGWIGTRAQMDALYEALKRDVSDGNAHRRSPNKIVSSVQKYRQENGLDPLVEGTDSYRQVINRILDRKLMPMNPVFISALWDLFVYEKLIVDLEAGDELSQLGHRLHDFLHEVGRKVSGLGGLAGWYYAYKPAVRSPEKTILKYLVQIAPFAIFQNVFVIKEFHFNRSFKPPESEVITEYWSGVIVARSSNTMFGIVREIINGTPKNITLHSPQPNESGLMIQIFGNSNEVVEKWGNQTTLSTSLMLERIHLQENIMMSDDEIAEKFGKECDLLDWRVVFNNKRYDIISQIMPNVIIPVVSNNPN